MKIRSIYILLILAISFFACSKTDTPGLGGQAIIEGKVKHHDTPIPNAIVYLKFGADKFPGTDVTLYDASTVASATVGYYKFENLQKGKYYLYAAGYDSTISQNVLGGTPTQIQDNAQLLELNIPVTE